MESDPEKIRELRQKQRPLTSEEFLDQVERHLGKRPQLLNKKSDSTAGPKVAAGLLGQDEWLGDECDGGMEHTVYLSTEIGRVVKITTIGGWGNMPTFRPRDGKIGLRPATPLEYLDRMALSNAIFGDDVLVHGVVMDRFPRIVVSQALVVGERPSDEEIDAAMAVLGFFRVVPGSKLFTGEFGGEQLLVADGHGGNFLRLEEPAGEVFAIDVIPATLTSELLTGVENVIRAGSDSSD